MDMCALALLCIAQELTVKGLRADEWVKSVCGLMGGKGGGKDISAQASGDNIACLEKAVAMAKEFASMKLLHS